MGWDCPSCGKELPTERAMRFHHREDHGERLPNQTCKGCGTEFYDPKYRRTYCDDCNPNAGEHNGNWKGGQETASCKLCGSEFSFYPSEKKGVYCPGCVAESDSFLGTPSQELREAERLERECEQCGVEMSVLESDADRGLGRFCSRACLSIWMSENVVGEAHHQWEGGSITYGQGWWSIRREALQRDGHACQACGSSKADLGREPDVHHVQPVRSFDDPQDAHFLENVVCLCRSCHRLVEEAETEIPERAASPKR